MLNLLVKDLKLLLFSGKDSLKSKIISLIFNILMLGILITIETFLFSMIINKVKDFGNPTPTILTIFLFVISCIMIVVDLFSAIKLFFNEKDIEQLTRYPVTNEQIILSKLIFLFLSHYLTSILFIYPIFISYGSIVGKPPLFYYFALFYPVLSFLFEAGVALLFVYPVKLLIDYLKKHQVLQFIIAMIFLVSACYVYSIVLSMFMELVVNNNLTLLFTVDNIEILKNVASNLIPITFLAQLFLGDGIQVLIYLAISLGVFLVGLVLSIVAFNYFRSFRFSFNPKGRKKNLKVTSVTRILIKKEISLLFKNSSNIFSFTGLLIIQPFLMYLVVDALNGVFTSGTFSYYIAMLPNFIPLLDMVLIMLFTLIINSGANSYITAEKHTIRIMKTIPVSVEKQMFIKVIIPFIASVVSLIASVLVLLIFEVITISTFIYSLVITIILLLIFELVSLKEELAIRMNKPRSTFLSNIYSYLLPITFFIASLICSYLKLEDLYTYLIGLACIILLGLPFIIRLKYKVKENFMDLEVVN